MNKHCPLTHPFGDTSSVTKIYHLIIIQKGGQSQTRKRLIIIMGDNEIQTLKKDVSQLKTDVAEIKVEVKSLKEDFSEMKTDIKELIKTVNTNHLYFVDNYVKKSEFNEYKKEEVISRRWWAGYIIGGTTLLLTLWKMISPYIFQAKS